VTNFRIFMQVVAAAGVPWRSSLRAALPPFC